MPEKGKIRVGRMIIKGSSRKIPSYEGYTPIVCLTKSSKYGSLGPYVLKNEKGQIMENVYQAHKIYKTLRDVREIYSRYQPYVVWQYPKQEHLKVYENFISEDEVEIIEEIQPEYWVWREKLMNQSHPVRYPAGFKNMKDCYASVIVEGDNITFIDYIQARKKIYIPLYQSLVEKQPQFKELKEILNKGENLLIIEVDGPHQESLEYYMSRYKVPEDFIVNDTVEVTRENMKILLNDTKHPFGHGYCLAMKLLGMFENGDVI